MKYRSKWTPYLFLAPATLFIFSFIGYPIFYSFYLIFHEYDYIFDDSPNFVGFSNIIDVLTEERFIIALTNTLEYTFFYLIIVVFGGFLIAVLLNSGLKGSSIYQLAIFSPIIVPLSLVGVVFVWILNPTFGIFNYLLEYLFGVSAMGRNWLASSQTALYSLVGMGVWKFMGLNVIIFLAGLKSIPKELKEAAKIDGANSLQELIWVIIPNIKNSFFLAGLYGIVQGIKVFEVALVGTGGGPGNATLTLYLFTYRQGFRYFNMGRAAILAYATALLILLSTAILNYFTKSEKR